MQNTDPVQSIITSHPHRSPFSQFFFSHEAKAGDNRHDVGGWEAGEVEDKEGEVAAVEGVTLTRGREGAAKLKEVSRYYSPQYRK